MSSEYAQIELCYAYGRALATHPLDLDAFRAILAPDVKLSFLPLSFGAPKIGVIDKFLGAVQHVVGGLTDLEYVIDGSEIGTLYVLILSFYICTNDYNPARRFPLRQTTLARFASANLSIIKSSPVHAWQSARTASSGSLRSASISTLRQRRS
jgi:hypothetical protein